MSRQPLFHLWPRLGRCTVAELFDELKELTASVPTLQDATMLRFRINQIELEIHSRELEETVADLSGMVESFAAHFYEAPTAYLLLDGNSRVQRANHAAERLFRVTESQLERQPMSSMLAHRDRPGVASLLREVERCGRARRHTRLMRLITGSAVRVVAGPHLGLGGQPMGFRVLLLAAGQAEVGHGRRRQLRTRGRLLASQGGGGSQGWQNLTQAAVEKFASMCLLDLASSSGELVRCHTTSRWRLKAELAAEIAATGPIGKDGWQTTQQQVFAQNKPLLVRRTRPSSGQEPVSKGRGDFPGGSFIIVPVVAGGPCLGTLTVLRAAREPRFCHLDLQLIAKLTRQWALSHGSSTSS